MADETWGKEPAVVRTLLEEGFRFSFFQAVRLLHHAFRGAVPVGCQGPVEKEVVRFRPVLDLAFPASDVERVGRVEGPGGQARYEVATTFLSLYGSVSPLPTYFTEDLLAQDDESLQREFLDLFHHRALSLFYRVWEKYRYAVQFAADGEDYFSRRLRLLLGLERLPARHRVCPVRMLGLAGLLTQIPRSAVSLRNLLSDYFEGLPVDVTSCAGRWVEIPLDQRNRLGVRNCRLGGDLSLGERVYDVASTFRVILGPLSFPDFMTFLPCGDRILELRELVDLMNTDGLDYEVELRLLEEDVPGLQLSSPGTRLGWSSWLGRREGMDVGVRFLVREWLHGRSEPQGADRAA